MREGIQREQFQLNDAFRCQHNGLNPVIVIHGVILTGKLDRIPGIVLFAGHHTGFDAVIVRKRLLAEHLLRLRRRKLVHGDHRDRICRHALRIRNARHIADDIADIAGIQTVIAVLVRERPADIRDLCRIILCHDPTGNDGIRNIRGAVEIDVTRRGIRHNGRLRCQIPCRFQQHTGIRIGREHRTRH